MGNEVIYCEERDIHCCSSVSYPSLDVKGRWKALLTSSTSPCFGLWSVTSDDVGSQIAYRMPDFGYPLCPGIWMMCFQEGRPLLLKCFVSSLRYMKRMRGTSDSIKQSFVVHTVNIISVHVDYLSNFIENARLWVPSLPGNWDGIVQWVKFIAVEVLHNLP